METPELLWGLRWSARKIPPLGYAYGGYQRWIRRIDIAHVHRSTLYADAFRAMNGKIPWIFTCHGIGFAEHWRHNPQVMKWIQASRASTLQAIETATHATVVARWLRDWVEERTSVSVAVTPPGIDLREFAGVDASRFCDWIGLSPGYVLWVGRLTHEKGVDWFIRLAARIPERQFVAISNSTEEQFLSVIGARPPPNFRLLRMLPREIVVSAFHGCSIHVNTSLYDTAPTTLVEAMVCGKPVVAPHHSGPREIVEDSGAGFLFSPGSLEDLEEQVRRALDHPELGTKGIEFAREQRDWRKLVRYFDEQYAGLARPKLTGLVGE